MLCKMLFHFCLPAPLILILGCGGNTSSAPAKLAPTITKVSSSTIATGTAASPASNGPRGGLPAIRRLWAYDPYFTPTAPHIDSVDWIVGTVKSKSLFLPLIPKLLVQPVVMKGNNFAAGQTLHVSGFQDVVLGSTGVTPTQLNLTLVYNDTTAFGQDVQISLTDQSGVSSNTGHLGIFYTNMARLWTGGNPLSSKLLYVGRIVGGAHLFSVAQLTEIGSFGADGNDLGVDPSTEVAALSGSIGVGLVPVANPILAVSFQYPDAVNPRPFMGVAAANGFVCGTQQLDDRIVVATYDMVLFFDGSGHPIGYGPLVKSVTALALAAGSTPVSCKLTTPSQLSAVVLNAGDGTVALVSLPFQGSQPDFVLTLPGFTKSGSLQSPMLGGWWMDVIESGSSRLVPVVDRAGAQVWFADLLARSVNGPFPLNGDAIGVVSDASRNSAIVEFYSPLDGTTRLERLAPDGTMTGIVGSFDLLTGGLTADSSFIYGCGGASTCKSVPQN